MQTSKIILIIFTFIFIFSINYISGKKETLTYLSKRMHENYFYLSVDWLNRSNTMKKITKENKQTIFVGSSNTAYAIKETTNSKNLGFVAADHNIMLKVLQNIPNDGIAKLVVELNPISFTHRYSKLINLKAPTYIIDLNSFILTIKDQVNILKYRFFYQKVFNGLILDSKPISAEILDIRVDEFSQILNGDRHLKSKRITSPDSSCLIEKWNLNSDKENNNEIFNLSALKDLINYSTNNFKNVEFWIPPYYFSANEVDYFYKLVNSLTKGKKVHRFTNVPKSYFLDCMHLNTKGAEYISRRIYE